MSFTKEERLPPTRLMTRAGWLGWVIPLGLLLVLGSNIIALFLPFLEIDMVLKGKSEYKLPESVRLMWSVGLYWVAILIVAFSIMFPLLKTCSLIIIWFLRMEPRRRNWCIRLLEALGKWSMLDVFVVILLMVLSNDQIFLSTTPKIGLEFFIFAIIGNMVMSRIVDMIDFRLHPDVHTIRDEAKTVIPLSATGWGGWVIPLLLVIAVISIVLAVNLPFLRINDALLHSNSYSIVQAAAALWEGTDYILSIFLILFVVAFPMLRILIIGWTWFTHRTKAAHVKRFELIRIVGEWSMMSVFLLALVMLLTEGNAMVKTQVKPGLVAIVVSLAVCVACLWISRWILRRHFRSI